MKYTIILILCMLWITNIQSSLTEYKFFTGTNYNYTPVANTEV